MGREGADLVVVEELEGIVRMFSDVLRQYRISAEDIVTHEDAIRRGRYAALREQLEEPAVVCRLDGHCLDTRTVIVRPGAAIVGRSADRLDPETGLLVRKIERDGQSLDPAVARITDGFVTNHASAVADAQHAFGPAGDRRRLASERSRKREIRGRLTP